MQSPKCLILINTAVRKLLPSTAIVSVHNPVIGQKLTQKAFASLLCLYLTAFFVCQILSPSEHWGESQYHLNNTPSIHVCDAVSPAALLPLPSPSEQSFQGFGSARPFRDSKGNEKALLAMNILHLRYILLWEVLRIFPSSPLRSNGSTMELTRWRDILGSHPKSTKGAWIHRGFKGFK